MAKTEKQFRAERLAEMKADPNDRSHGKLTGYTYGCRCAKCRGAYGEYRREHNEERRLRAKRWEMEQRAARKQAQADRLARLMEAAGPRIVRIHGIGEIEI